MPTSRGGCRAVTACRSPLHGPSPTISASKAGRERALKVLTESVWDGGIITEGIKPESGAPEKDGRAFATAAGYVAHVICEQFCIHRKPGQAKNAPGAIGSK